jgi:hypothetical protein
LQTPVLVLFPVLMLVLLLVLAAGSATGADGAASGELTAEQAAFFESRIRPLLVEHCYSCHSATEKQQGGLVLDTRAGWQSGGDSGPAIEPGDVEASLLIEAIRYENNFLKMPPKRKLPAEAIAAFEQWVQMGAPDPRQADAEGAPAPPKPTGMSLEEGRRFWAFVPPAKPERPQVADTAWPRSDLDYFILQRLEQHALPVVQDADRAALARRAYFDLIGLPPTPEQLDEFLADVRPDAFAHLVDQLLSLPQYGERWGRHWLDVARFAESSGGGRTLLFKDAWRYRDYVIDAFNRDLPFDRFIAEQLAGDLLPYEDHEQRGRQLIATGFLALGPTNYEEQDKRALRMDIVDEQLDTLGKAFMGLALGCARCHDHKFDPIPTRDYYALAGILRSTAALRNYTDNVAHWVEVPLPLDPEREAELSQVEQRIAALQAEIKDAKGLVSRLAGGAAPAAPAKSIAARDLPGIVVDDVQAQVVGQWQTSQFNAGYVGDGYVHDQNQGKGEKAITYIPTIPASGVYEVRLSYTAGSNRASNVPVTLLHADGELTLTVNQRAAPPIDGRFVSLGKYRFEKDGAGYLLISNEGTDGHVIADALQWIPQTPASASPPGNVQASAGASAAPAEQPGAEEAEKQAEKQAAEETLKRLEAELKQLQGQLAQRPQTMAVRDDDIGDTEIRIRGNVHAVGQRVPRGFLQVVGVSVDAPFTTEESGRRQLAEWLASPAHPLTARVFANRVWTWLMGAGLVRTVDNFGSTGEAPTHPELLDYLAVRLREQGWSVKQLVKEIMLSRTYQLATAAPDPADPDNRWFSRAHRRRLDAEQIRDAMLLVSGQLSLDVGGLNIRGAGAIDANSTAAQDIEYSYQFEDTRRSVYTPAFRNKRLELFEVFDFADINATQGQRSVSTVAPQALFMMNHPFVIEHSRLAAEQLHAAGLPDDAARIDRAYREVLGRRPTPAEKSLALRYISRPAAENRAPENRAAEPASSGADSQSTDRQAEVELWSELYQSLFACIDFRYLE